MANLFEENAYQTLGLDSSVNQKDIVKRGKEILNLLQIDEKPNYKLDTSLYLDSRSKENTKQAIEDLSKPERRIKESFFWFDFRDSIDEKALKLIKNNELTEVINLWGKEIKKENSKSYFYKKNLAILLSVLLEKNGQKNYLHHSISLWNDIIKDNKFWSVFYKNYRLFDDLNTRDDVLFDFQQNASKYLAEFYTNISRSYKDKSFFEEFYKVFNIKGSNTDDVFLNKIYQKIDNDLSILNKISQTDSSHQQIASQEEIKAIISSINSSLTEIKALGLYDSSEIKVRRDKIAEVIRSLSVYLHNEPYNLVNEAFYLIKEANKICGTASLKEKIRQDLEIIEASTVYKDHESELNIILNYIKKGDLKKAIGLLNLELTKEKLPLKLRELYLKTKNDLETRLHTYGKPVNKAPTMYCINGCGTRVYGDTLYFVLLFIPILPWARYSVTAHGNGQYTFFGKLELHTWQKIWKYIGLAIIGLWLLSAMSSSGSNTSSSTPTTTVENNCTDSQCSEKYSNSIFSRYDNVNSKCICTCPTNMMWNDNQTGCINIDYNALCKKKFGPNSYWTGRFEGDKYICN